MAERGSLIPPDAQRELERQDRERASARERTKNMDYMQASADFTKRFSASIQYEFTLIDKWGASATTRGAGDEELVTQTVRQKFPPRKIGRFEMWQMKTFHQKNGTPMFQFPPCRRMHGIIFNEGGRGLTFTSIPSVPFRLYIAGWVLMYNQKKWSLKHHI